MWVFQKMEVYCMKISNNFSFVNQANRMNALAMSAAKRLASGERFPHASYGPSAYSILARMNTNVGTISQSARNNQKANSMLNVAAGGVESTISALSSLRAKVLEAANGTNKTSDIDTIGKAFTQTVATIDENAAVQYNGKNLLNGMQKATIVGDNGYTTLQLNDMTARGLGLVDENGEATINLHDTTPDGIEKNLNTIDAALEKALDEATTIGAAQQGLQYATDNYVMQGENITGSASTIGDTDMAEMLTKFKSEDTLNQLALYAMKLHMHNNAGVLSLLR